ncbi:MAG: hypothetical protein HPZ91_00575 [Lentisphaeria bacterium]|nr:hypothetical protein [Lentisphaeria bacterium]
MIDHSKNLNNQIEYNGKNLTLTQEAYIDGTYENPYYTASATDDDGKEYIIIWIPYNNYEERCVNGDESDACNWDEYKVKPQN